ncbi:MAG TPA: thioredoxin domain-containing protein, partial [Candidatus Dormibacteraeota bacterium]|nr:thioredoxin domain-containing protein [Candidatus Dormibacteraeota bacterium]
MPDDPDPVAGPRSDAGAVGGGPSSDGGHRHTNRLAGETSPYLLQHAHNPVDWYPWGQAALAKAASEDKPIFLSIGYAACHWCHVMERESFEDETTAAELNRGFVPVKVDREERPDLDQLYMAAVVAMTGQGGWPMSVFLTPEGRPFYGGTYFPDRPRQGMPSFRQVLEGVRRAWDEQRPELEQAATRLVSAIASQQVAPEAGPLPDRATLEGAMASLDAAFDPVHGGWGRAPKFPAPMTIEWLLRRWGTGDARAIAMARRTLDRMADGGLFDQLGGGFHRYSTDGQWLVPHFEKMLYDNAQLARAYIHAWQATDDARYRDVAVATLDYLLRELRTADGAFAASQDADTEGVEGATFTWTAAGIDEALRDAGAGEDVALFASAYGVRPQGNWEGRTILSRVRPAAALAQASDAPPESDGATAGDAAHASDTDGIERRLARDRGILLAARQRRAQPTRDDKALAAWNGLAIAALADASRALAAHEAGGEASGSAAPAMAERAAIYREAAERA